MTRICHGGCLLRVPVPRTKGPIDTGQIDDAVNLPHGLCRRLHALCVRDIDSLETGLAGQFSNQRSELAFGPGGNDHLGPCAAQLLRQSGTQPAARTH
jgi:hypothetical protein